MATVKELLLYLLGGSHTAVPEKPSPWPPDVFACSASILNKSGGYRRLVGGTTLLGPSWIAAARSIGGEWRKNLQNVLATQAVPRPTQDSTWWETTLARLNACELPTEIREWWKIVSIKSSTEILDVSSDDELTRSLLSLCLVADEASQGVGFLPQDDDVLRLAELALVHPRSPNRRSRPFRTMCVGISPEKVRVLPKQHTPQRGLTIRSLTHHLALCPASEVTAGWIPPWHRSPAGDVGTDLFNALLFPWPFAMSPRSFAQVERAPETGCMPKAYGHFAYQRDSQAGKLHDMLERALATAESAARRINAVIMPEAALTMEEYKTVEDMCLLRELLLVTGAYEPGTPSKPGRNLAVMQPAGFTRTPILAESQRIIQSKHHRWCLDRNQILQYQLGGVVPASRQLWEYIQIPDRSIYFITPCNWLTLCVLVCEDLARLDPVPDVLRAVGPNLVIALLMDGPQLRNRWPSRYASVLAEDPGSSVLSITSLGMAALSQPRSGESSRSRCIALWRDAWFGERELELPAGKDCAVLSLTCRSEQEYSADGRGDGWKAHFPVFSGFYPLDWTAA